MEDRRPLRYFAKPDEIYLKMEIGEETDFLSSDGNRYRYVKTGLDFRAKPKAQFRMKDPERKVRCRGE